MSYNTTIIRNFENLPIGRKEWGQLVAQNEINTIFQTYGWFTAWWETFGNKDNLFIILLHNKEDKLVALAPLCIKNNIKNKPELVFIGDGNADYVDFLISENKEEILLILLGIIDQHSHEFSSFVLRNLPQYSSTCSLLTAISCNTDHKLSIIQKIVCPTLVIKNRRQDAEKVLHKYSVKRPFNYFSKQGRLHHEVLRDIDIANEHIEVFFEQHIERWDKTRSPSLFLEDTNKIFYKTLLSNFLPEGRLLFSALMLDDNPLSYHFGFDYNSIVTWYKPSYSVKFAKKSPGTLMVKFLIEYALENKRNELDFTIGDEPFKDRFANVYRYNVAMIYFPNKSGYFIFECLRKMKNMLKFFVKRTK